MAVVARAAGLANVLTLGLGGLADGLQINHLRLIYIELYSVIKYDTVTNLLQLRLAHSSDARFTIGTYGFDLAERTLREKIQDSSKPLLVIVVRWAEGQGQYWAARRIRLAHGAPD